MMLTTVLIAGIARFAVPATGDARVLPDSLPASAVKDAPCAIVAARGEYEGGSFVLRADADYGKLAFRTGDLKNERGDVFPASELDLTTVKVWYQNSNAWISYFQDPRLVLCPELLLHDEDLVRVDTEKKANYARLTEKDGSVSYRWLNPPRPVDTRTEDAPGCRLDDSFLSMKPNFADAETHQGVTLKKGEYKQFWLTVKVPSDATPGDYTGALTVKSSASTFDLDLHLKVHPFSLPYPRTHYDSSRRFLVTMMGGPDLARTLASGRDLRQAEEKVFNISRTLAEHNVLAQIFGKLLGDGGAKLIIEGHNGGHIDDAHAQLLLGCVAVSGHNLRKHAEIVAFRHDSEHADGQGIDSLEHVGGQLVTLLREKRRIAEGFAQVRVAAVDGEHLLQLVANVQDAVLAALFKGGVQEHVRIRCDFFFCEQSISRH